MDNYTSVKISDVVYDKQKFINTTDTQFRELTSATETATVTIPTVEDFFLLYEQLFYIIPKEGDNSHTTIIEQSGNYIGLNTSENVDIQTLLDEITALRDQNFELQSLLSQIQSTSTDS